jgi:hypothetical protein
VDVSEKKTLELSAKGFVFMFKEYRNDKDLLFSFLGFTSIFMEQRVRQAKVLDKELKQYSIEIY